MIKKLHFKLLLLLAAVVMGAGTAWGADETITLSNGSYSTDHITWSGTSVEIQQQKGSSSTDVNSSYVSAPRVYKGHILSFEAKSGYKIKSISITVSGTYYGNSMTAGTSVSGNTVTDNTTDVARTWTTTSGGTHVVSSVGDGGLDAIYIQNVASTNVQLRFTALSVEYVTTGSGTPTTYTVTYDANGGTGTLEDSNSPYDNGSTVTVLANTFTRDGYTFSNWNTAADGSGTGYDADDTFTITANTTLYAQWTEVLDANTTKLTFDLSSNPGEWPTANTTTLTNYTYTLDNVDYTFGLKNVKCNSGYLFLTNPAALGLPAIEGKRLAKVVVHNSNGCSTAVNVGISTSDTSADYVTGGDAQTWSTQGSAYTYTLTSTSANTVYYLYVTNKNAQVTSLDLYYEVDNTPAPPTITAGNVSIDYDATSGEIAYTVNNPVTGTNLTAAAGANDTWISNITVAADKVTFTATANTETTERTATITLTYGSVTKDVTVTQGAAPAPAQTIAEVRTQGTGSVHTVGVVTSVNGRTAYIQDANAAIVVYGSSNLSVAVGDQIDVTGTLTTYSGLLEIGSPTISVLTQNNTVTPEVMTIEQVNASTNQGWLVKIEDAAVTAIDGKNVTIAQNSDNIVVRFNADPIGFAVDDEITLTGNIGCYNNAAQIANPTDISVQASTNGTITITGETNISVTADGVDDGNIAFTLANIDTDMIELQFVESDGTTTATYDWLTADFNTAKNAIEYIVDANTGAERTAYMKIYGIDNNVNDVYSDLITVTQAAYVAPPTTSTYRLASTITSGKSYVIVGTNNGALYAMGEQKDNNRAGVAVTDNGGELSIASNSGVTEFVVTEDNGTYTIYDAAKGYLYAAGSNKNYLKSQATNDVNGEWTITIDADTYAASVVAGSSSNRNNMRFNYNSGSTLFSCYASTSTMPGVYFYEKDGAALTETITLASACTDGTKYYGTYSSAAAFAVPANLTVSEIKVENGVLALSNYAEGEVVPANTGVMVASATAGNHTVAVTIGGTSKLGTDNNLKASSVAMEGDNLYYRLTMHNGTDIGFWWGAANGAAFTIVANKAYLAVPSTTNARMGFSLNGETTGILDNNRETITNNRYFDMQGRRVAQPQKGLYIVNGKKVVTK